MPRAARHLRRRARAGSCTARRSSACGCGTRSGRRATTQGPGRRRIQGGRLAAAGEGLSRVGLATSAPRSDPYQAGLGFCVKLDKGDFIGREALLEEAGDAGRQSWRAWCSTTRAQWRWAQSRSASGAKWSGASPAAGTAIRWAARSRTRTCRRTAPSARRSKWRSSARGSPVRSPRTAIRPDRHEGPGLTASSPTAEFVALSGMRH